MERYIALQQQLHQMTPELEVRLDEPLDNHTTLRIGGPATVMALPKTVAQAQGAVGIAHQLGIDPIFWGKGSNLLVADDGVDGFVLKTSGLRNLALVGEDVIVAESGVPLAQLAKFALDHGLTGLEFAYGIPGSVGGAIAMNAGAYGGEMSQVVVETTFLTDTGELAKVVGEGHEFAYRHSVFLAEPNLIVSATLQLKKGDPAEIRGTMERLTAQRREKQPLEYPSGGSTFKRPPGHFAAALIDQCGLKGVQVGGAQVSEKHAGFLINRGGATCADMWALIEKVREKVEKDTGITLELELKEVGHCASSPKREQV